MPKGHFKSTYDNFDWPGFQKHMGYTDEELATIKNDPRRSEYVKIMCADNVQNKYLICEVIESDGCISGLEIGDRIVYKGLSTLDLDLSTGWCPHITTPNWFVNNMKIFLLGGIDPEASYVTYSGCMDIGVEKGGLGKVVYKTYILEKDQLGQLK